MNLIRINIDERKFRLINLDAIEEIRFVTFGDDPEQAELQLYFRSNTVKVIGSDAWMLWNRLQAAKSLTVKGQDS